MIDTIGGSEKGVEPNSDYLDDSHPFLFSAWLDFWHFGEASCHDNLSDAAIIASLIRF